MQSRWLCILYFLGAACHKAPRRDVVFALDCPASTDLGSTLGATRRHDLDVDDADHLAIDVVGETAVLRLALRCPMHRV